MDLFRRARFFCAAGVCTAALVACGGGGGGGSVPPTGGGGATPTPSPAPTLPASSSASVTTSTSQAQTGIFGPIAGGYSGSVTIPATSVATTVNATFTTTQPSGPPAPSALQRRPQNIGASPISALAYLSVTSPVTVTFPQAPSFTVTLPYAVTPAMGATSYVAVYDSSKPQSGWNTIEGPSTVNGSTLSFNGTFGGAVAPLTLTANQPVYFLLFTVSSALPSPSPSPSLSPSASPSPTPAAITLAPAVGYLPSNGASSFAGSLLTNKSTTLVGISTNEISGAPSSAVGTASVTFNIGLGIQNASRAPLATRSTAARYTTSVPLLERAVDGPQEVAAIMSQLRGASRTERAALSTRRTSSLGTTVGSTTAFWAQNAALGASSGTFAQVPATLQNVSSYGYIWIDNTLSLSASTMQQIGADFDNAYLSDTAHFGTSSYTASAPGFASGPYTACDATGAPTGTSVPAYITPTGGKINVFVINPSSLGTGVGGYFSQLNYVPQAAINCIIGTSGYTASSVPHSNEAPMIYVAYNTANSVTYETQEDLVRGTAHEFQHLVNFVNHAILNGNAVEDRWINEGMSMLAQDFAVDQLFHTGHDFDDAGSHAIDYLAAPQNFSLTAFTGIDPQKTTQQFNCGGCYGSEYLFQRYLYDRFGGDAYLKKMLGSSTSYANLQQATGIDPRIAISDFAIALAASGTSATTDPRFGFTSLNLLASYPDQFGRIGSFGGPVPAATLTGQITNSYMLGSFVYYNAGMISQGVTITAKDPTGLFGLRAGVVQR